MKNEEEKQCYSYSYSIIIYADAVPGIGNDTRMAVNVNKYIYMYI
jgi:hypothetical protein